MLLLLLLGLRTVLRMRNGGLTLNLANKVASVIVIVHQRDKSTIQGVELEGNKSDKVSNGVKVFEVVFLLVVFNILWLWGRCSRRRSYSGFVDSD